MLTEATEFLKKVGSQFLLNSAVKKIKYRQNGVMVSIKGGGCTETEYAICTFSLGVLQNDVVEFKPEIPHWKQEAIA